MLVVVGVGVTLDVTEGVGVLVLVVVGVGVTLGVPEGVGVTFGVGVGVAVAFMGGKVPSFTNSMLELNAVEYVLLTTQTFLVSLGNTSTWYSHIESSHFL